MLKTFIFRYLCTLWSILAAAEHVPDNQVLISNWNCYLPLWQQAPCKDCKWSKATLVICVMISYCVEVELSEAGLQTLFCNECWIVYKWSSFIFVKIFITNDWELKVRRNWGNDINQLYSSSERSVYIEFFGSLIMWCLKTFCFEMKDLG